MIHTLAGLSIDEFGKKVGGAIIATGSKFKTKDIGKLIYDIAAYDCTHGTVEQINNVGRRFMYALSGDNVDDKVQQNVVLKLCRDNFNAMLPAMKQGFGEPYHAIRIAMSVTANWYGIVKDGSYLKSFKDIPNNKLIGWSYGTISTHEVADRLFFGK